MDLFCQNKQKGTSEVGVSEQEGLQQELRVEYRADLYHTGAYKTMVLSPDFTLGFMGIYWRVLSPGVT